VSALTVQQEHYSDVLRDELMPMLEQNWKESPSYNQEIALAPNFERYKYMDSQGMVMCLTARDEGRLVGYAIWYVVTSFNYQGKSGHGVAAYIEEAHRGHGMDLLRKGEALLREQGIQRFYWFARPGSTLYKLLQRLGYVADEAVMEKVNGLSRQ
jgi:GNAT superfamily N-acetyltransferase